MRIIFKKEPDEISVENLHKLANIALIKDRAIELRDKYLNNCHKNNNPMITNLVSEYEKFKSKVTNRKYSTLLDEIKDKDEVQTIQVEDDISQQLSILFSNMQI